MAQRFVYGPASSPALPSNNLSQFADEFRAANIPGTEPIEDEASGRPKSVYSIHSDGTILTVGVVNSVVKRDVDAVVVAHVPDSEYGKFVPISEAEILAMTFEELRAFVASRFGEVRSPFE